MSLVLSALDSSRTRCVSARSTQRQKGSIYKSDRPKVSFVLSIPKGKDGADEPPQEDLRFLDRLKHPHISRLSVSMKDTGACYEIRILAHIEGQTLRDFISCRQAEGAQILEDKIWALLAQLLDAAAACQRLSRPHLNMIPSNIYISDLYYLKVGRPLLTREQMEATTRSRDALPYRSLEFISNEAALTSAEDVWAIGCIGYELCTLTPLFTIQSINDILNRLQGFSRMEGIPGYSPELFHFLTKMLDLDDSTRISAQEALQHPRIRHSVGQFRYNIETELSKLTLDDLPDLFQDERTARFQTGPGRTIDASGHLTMDSLVQKGAAAAAASRGIIRNVAISRLSMSLQECVKLAESQHAVDKASEKTADILVNDIDVGANQPRCKTPTDSPLFCPDLAMTPGESALLNFAKVQLQPCMHMAVINDRTALSDARCCTMCGKQARSIVFLDGGLSSTSKDSM